MLFLLFSLQCVIGVTVFDLDESDVVFLPVGGKVELHKKADIIRARTWVFTQPDVFRLKLKAQEPKREKDSPFSIPKFTVIEASCTRDCKIGEEFKINLNYKDLAKQEVLEKATVTIRVVSPNEDL